MMDGQFSENVMDGCLSLGLTVEQSELIAFRRKEMAIAKSCTRKRVK